MMHMRKILLSYAAIFILIVVYIPASAQKKDFTYDQLFKENTSITKALPAIRGWEDDDHYVDISVSFVITKRKEKTKSFISIILLLL